MEIGLGAHSFSSYGATADVLILVLVEIGLGAQLLRKEKSPLRVLILVLVEIGLGVFKKNGKNNFCSCVLILVLVEIGLGVPVVALEVNALFAS